MARQKTLIDTVDSIGELNEDTDKSDLNSPKLDMKHRFDARSHSKHSISRRSLGSKYSYIDGFKNSRT